MSDNQNLMAGVMVYHENAQGHMVSNSGEHLALIRHRAITFEVMSCQIDDGRMHVLVYHTFMTPAADPAPNDETELPPVTEEPKPKGKKNDS